ncbi:low temperature requirement protein A [Ottowia thiooxydans]|uniref:low temperature requirement protein A n=1 Tax=Ottowia thiooxydans TaxID=219182 RepID=UPI00040B0AFF|nr:low temperature requirement protein A [Ottowia thiooxydans]
MNHSPAPLQRPTRGRDIHEQHRVATPLELLFDLTFVVAVALAAAQLHHAEAAHHVWQALSGYLLAFFAIWWAWMNYTWFASAYDNDDAAHRVLTFFQMGGVLVFATGVPGLFEGQFFLGVLGYALMRLPQCVQWIRAGMGDPERRSTCWRYAKGVAFVQVLWVLFHMARSQGWLPEGAIWPTVAVLVVLDLSVPAWAEHNRPPTPWHAHHIAERYSGFIIIILGEAILGTTNAIAGLVQAHASSSDLVLVGLGGTLLAFCLWWMYFLLPFGEALHHHRERSFGWGYGHYFAFASLAAVGSGLEVVADTLKSAGEAAPAGHAAASPLFAISAVAIPAALFVFFIWALHRYVTRAQDRQMGLVLMVLACIGLGPLAVALGLPLPWGLLLLSVGPALSIIYNELGRKRRADQFSVR